MQDPSGINSERNKTNGHQPDEISQHGHGPQGVDKAPGEEPSEDNVQFTQQTQKGKQSVDGDVDRPEDGPLDRQDL
ncbi:MAG: hypothetical protein EOO08_03890 [Chitinophagaceae bacterium]|nr:MAG: hypothetical protein EOO08_03890 [Chitinophagaceae bacterium]